MKELGFECDFVQINPRRKGTAANEDLGVLVELLAGLLPLPLD